MIWVSIVLAILGFFSVIFTLPEIGGVQVKWVIPLLDGILIGFAVWLLSKKKISVKVLIAGLLVAVLGPLALTIVAIIALTFRP